MKLALIGLAAVAQANISIEKGGKWGETECKGADAWFFSKLGGELKPLEPTAADAEAGEYVLQNNVLTITPDSKKRNMMGDIECRKDGTALASVKVTGLPVFKNLANALTVLDKDQNKRIECEVSGYPIPTASWKFQAVEKEMFANQCPDASACSYACVDNCDPQDAKCKNEDHDVQESCVAEYYEKNSTDLFTVLGTQEAIAENVAVRYINTNEPGENEADGCPMDSTPITDERFATRCKIATQSEDLNDFGNEFKRKTQLFFSNVEYIQGGKYICVATQKVDQKTTVTRTKPFIWRVKDPMAALWPFLALVAEVIVVVCIILYYERASQKKENVETAEEGDEFIESKKEES